MYVVNWNFDKQSLGNERWQALWVRPTHKIHFHHLSGWLTIPNTLCNLKWKIFFVILCIYHKYTHGFLNLMVHNILQSDLHGFKAFVSSNLPIFFVPPNVTTIVPKKFQHKLNFFSFANFFEFFDITCVKCFIKLRIC